MEYDVKEERVIVEVRCGCEEKEMEGGETGEHSPRKRIATRGPGVINKRE